MRSISILGSTGSVGTSTVDLVASSAELKVEVLTAHKNVTRLAEQAKRLKPKIVAIGDEVLYAELKAALSGEDVTILAGADGVCEAAATQVDWTMAAIVGVAGLKPILNAIASSKVVAIANKEPLVVAGDLVLREAARHGTKILPVDSEHNAIFQVFEERNRKAIDKIILTASGGPFRTWDQAQIDAATPEQAVAHPNWSMGAKISVDSASMMNKGLEVIEAHHLFQMTPDRIDVILHPQSIIHSMVEYADGSVLAQLGAPDMRTPIAYALAWPDRMATTGQRLDWKSLSRLDFGRVDTQKFPCLAMAYEALCTGTHACIALNAANEIAVSLFLSRQIGFSDIPRRIRAILDTLPDGPTATLEDMLAYDQAIREKVLSL